MKFCLTALFMLGFFVCTAEAREHKLRDRLHRSQSTAEVKPTDKTGAKPAAKSEAKSAEKKGLFKNRGGILNRRHQQA